VSRAVLHHRGGEFRLRNRSAIEEPSHALRTGGSRWPHVILAGLVAAYSVFSYVSSFQTNPITGERQRIAFSPRQEIAMGQEAAPKMIAQHGGLDPDEARQLRVAQVGAELVRKSLGAENPYPFEFHVLKNDQVMNAFALPGGQVFITAAFLDQLKTDGQLAGVLAHEIGHVVERHAAERLSKTDLAQGLTGALILSSRDSDNPDSKKAAQVALAISHLIKMKYGREDELEADRDGIHIMIEAGYDPKAMIRVIEILRANGDGMAPEFFSTHPEPDRADRSGHHGIVSRRHAGVAKAVSSQ
jgi:beta-barrel assembly-enhancing protease